MYGSDLPRAPPNDPERSGNIWLQHEQLQLQYQQLLDQNTQMASDRTHYQNDRRQTESAVGMLLQENHSLHQQVSSTPYVPPTASSVPVEHNGSETSDQSAHRSYTHTPSHRYQRFNSLQSDSMVSPRAALQSIFPGRFNAYDHSPDNSSQAESYEQQFPAQQHQHNQQYFASQSQSGSPGSAIDQLGQLRSELAAKDEQIVQLQHTLQSVKGKSQALQHTVDDADAHRRQVQLHNGELQTQIDALLAEMEGLRQGQSWGGNPDHMHQLTQANLELNNQLAEMSHKLETHDMEPQGISEQEAAQMHDKVAQLESANTDLSLKLSQVESQLRHDHQRELRRIESEKENRLLELKGEHETLISLLTEQNERLEAELKDATETARTAATAAATSPMGSATGSPTTSRDLSPEDERKVQGLKATILQLVEENKSLAITHEHNGRLKQEVQQMMKVKSELEDLRQHKSKLQSQLAAKIQSEEKLQEQLQALTADKAALQEQVQQAERATPAGSPALQAEGSKKEKEAADSGYTNTWRLVDQLRTQNRQLSAEMAELRAGKESQGSMAGKENQGTSAESTRTSGSLLRRLGLKKAKDRSTASSKTAAAVLDHSQLSTDSDLQSNNSFNEDQSQAASGEQASELDMQEVQHVLDSADERTSQAEQRALKAEEATQAQEGLISQLCDENLKLAEEIQRLNTSMKLVKDLSEENTRLLRDNKRANESLDGMLKDNADLNNRLVNIAFQSPDGDGDIFDDAFADPAELAERAEKRKKAASERQATAGGSGRAAASGMDSAMQKRQEATAAEVRAREEALARDEERHQQLKEESKKQLDTYERVKDKVSSTSAPFSLARQRLQRANSGINGHPASDSNPQAGTTTIQPVAATKSPSPTPPRPSPIPSQTSSRPSPTPSQTSPRPSATPLQTPPRPAQTSSQAPPRAATSTPERPRAHRMLVASPAVDLTPHKQASASTPSSTPSRGPPARQSSVRAPSSPPMSHSAVVNSTAGSSSPRQGSEAGKTTGTGTVSPGEAVAVAQPPPLTPERMPSGRRPPARIPPASATPPHGEPGRNLKPIQTTRSLSREGSLTRTESGNDRLRQEADASRAEIWRKIQAAKLNNSKKHQEATAPEAAVQQAAVQAPTASPMSPTQGLVMNGPASARTMADSSQRPSGSSGRHAAGQQAAPRMAPPIAQSGSARDQVDAAYLEYGPDHNIAAFMQSLGYSDFTAASADEEKMTQFKRALKLTRPAFAATRSPMQQELANAVYAKLQSWVDQFVYKR